MKNRIVVLAVILLAFACGLLVAQQPAGSAARGGQRAATGAMLDIANRLAESINKQDSATLQKMIASDAVYLDEDGHAPPIQGWIVKLTTGTPAKQITISSSHSQMWDNAGWVSFNYSLTEQFQGAPKTVKGTASLMLRKPLAGDWQIQLIHGALEQKVAGLTQ